MTLESLLKSNGWTDQDLADIAPMLQNAKFRATLETQYTSLASERDNFKGLNDEWQRKLDEDYNPRMTAAETEAQKARLQLAEANEKLRIAKDYGYLDGDAQAKADEAAAKLRPDPNGYDPKRHPTFDDVAKFADAEAEAIAMANDLSQEYAFLSGGRSLFEYEGQNGARGMRALRAEAKAARKPLETYVAEKFQFADKRTAMNAAKQKEHDDSIRREESERVRAELAQQYGNPMLRSAVPSRAPFIPAGPAGTGGKPLQPWERGNPQERKAERLSKLITMNLKTA